jgi:DNA-binding SARP family transcriptional activator
MREAAHHLEDSMERHDASALPAKPAASPTPWLRIHTLGRFQIDWVDPLSVEVTPLPVKKLRGPNAATALGLLKALLSCPDRFATRAWLNEQFWPNSRHKTAEERLNDVVSSLRALLRPEGCTEMFVHFVHGTDGRGTGFRLDTYPQLWCDADAFEWYVKHAMLLDQRGQDSTACWERAYVLAERGPYLPEQVYEEWARQKRDYLTGLVRDCIHRWTTLLRRMGHVDEAIMRLRSYWLEHPTDEDALRPLLDMLGERGRFREAEEYYDKARLALAEDGQIIDERTTETIESVKALKIQRPLPQLSSSLVFSLGNQKNMKAVSLLEEHYYDMDPLRRAISKGLLNLIGGVVAPAEWWERLASPRSSAINAETFLSIQQLLEAGWGLSNAGELHVAEQVLVSFLPRMLQLAPQRQEAAALAAEGLRLHGILAAHQQRISDKLTMCLQAVEYARQANNHTILIAQLTELAIAFIYARQPANALRTYQEALSYCEDEQISPFVRSRIYAAAAPTLAKYGEGKKAFFLIDKAYESFPTRLEGESNAFSADNRLFMIDYYQGLLHLVENQPAKAYQAFEQALTRPFESQMPERWRLIIINYQGLSSILSHQLEPYAHCLEESLAGSLLLGSKKRRDEAVSIYQQHLPKTWYTAPSIKQIVERFQLEQEDRRGDELEI